ncbi:MAG: FAD-linked oxidase C-terminal domain-containing protein [Pseudomonadota bacterium]
MGRVIEDASGSRLARRLSGAVEGEVLFDAFSRGRYATDASIYQMTPAGVVVPKGPEDLGATLALAAEEGLPVLPRGGGTSQCGQTVNEAVVLDCSRHFNKIIEIDVEGRRAVVEPGCVLDTLNRVLKPHGLWYPVDVSTGSRATIGGMTANNSCGARSRRYGTSRDNVISIDALLADGTRAHFGPASNAPGGPDPSLVGDLLRLAKNEAEEIAERFPDVDRRVGGYNLDALVPGAPQNLAHLLVGSEGTLAISERIEIKLSPLQGPKLLGICHFPSFREAMEAPQHLVDLDPVGIELIDHTMIHLARENAVFRPVLEEFVEGEPAALLLVEFAETDPKENRRRLDGLHDLMARLGYGWRGARRWGGVVEATDPGLQNRIGEVRKQGLNIMMSMKQEGKPVSFVEDCCVRLEDLADYTERLTAIFHKHGTDGTWYAHASVGTLHVRPVLNLKEDIGVKALRGIAEEAFALVRDYKGSHSGEHGDGIVRSEFHEQMFGGRIVRAFEAVKDRFDPEGRLNPGKIVRAPRIDDRSLFRYPADYRVKDRETVFDWPGYPGAARGLQGAVEMCNNNGACRKLEGGVMCPSYRVTREEVHSVRGRANTLRLALSGQLGEDAFASDAMAETMKLCVSCKACKRECPMSVDMAKLKIEVQAARAARRGYGLRDRLVAHMPRYAPVAARFPGLSNLRNRLPWLARLMERVVGFSAERPLPEWRQDWFRGAAEASDALQRHAPFVEHKPVAMAEADVVLFADSFNRWFEPGHLRAALAVLAAGGYRIAHAEAPGSGRALCCGRTYLSTGMTEMARDELRRTAEALRPALERGVPVVGLEPSCLLTFRDEAPRLLPEIWSEDWGSQVMLLEEFLAAEDRAGRLALPLGPLPQKRALLHGHCHQKAFAQMGAVERVMRLIPGLEVEMVETSCCGMAGSFGYQVETLDASRAMAEASLLPAVRAADKDTIVVADGTSCRHQIADGTGLKPVHVALLLAQALDCEAAAAADRDEAA